MRIHPPKKVVEGVEGFPLFQDMWFGGVVRVCIGFQETTVSGLGHSGFTGFRVCTHSCINVESKSQLEFCCFVLPLLHCLILFVCVFQISASDRVSALFCLLRGWL